ncbi:MAG: winged helix-turn-helix transcriptional regulator [Chloroflexi bacterium]|nr:winged helix-turn-helix transcriptional regulator [Chloroflexota bacterium]
MSPMGFLTNYGLLLAYIARNSRATARELASAVGITERAVRKLITDLVEEGYLERQREGRRNRYEINPDLSLRHPTYLDVAVGDLLRILGWKPKGKKASRKNRE